jgi:hypothetical protein
MMTTGATETILIIGQSPASDRPLSAGPADAAMHRAAPTCVMVDE